MKNQNLWIIFSLIFLLLSIFYFYQSKQKIPKIINKGGIKKIMGVKVGMEDFVQDFGDYIDKLNKQNQIINIISGIGYLAAFFTSIYSYFLSV